MRLSLYLLIGFKKSTNKDKKAVELTKLFKG